MGILNKGALSTPVIAGSNVILGVSNAAFGVALTRIGTFYSGPCIRVRRTSDNTQQDIGFNGNDLDTAALLSFVGGGSGFVVTWYDQSGQGRHFTQSDTGMQPRIVLSGVIDTWLSKPSLRFDGVAMLASPAFTAFGSGFTLLFASVVSVNSTFNAAVSKTNGANSSPWDIWGTSSSGNLIAGDNRFIGMAVNYNASAPFGVYSAWGSQSVGAFLRTNGNFNGGDNNPFSSFTDTGTPVVIGSRGDYVTRLNGYLPEAFAFPSVLPQATRLSLESSRMTYFGI